MDFLPASEPTESTITRWLKLVAPAKRSEVLTVTLLALNCFILLTCYYVLKVVREPLILLGGGGAELKAYSAAGQTILLIGIVPAFGWLSSKVSRIRLMTTMQIIFIGCLVAFYVLAQAKAPIGLAFYLWLGIFNVLVVSNFWSFANDLYTAEQGKRLFAIIGFGASVGAVLGAFVPRMLHAALGIHGLMLIAVVGLGVSIVLYQVVDRREGARKHEVAATKQPAAADVKDKKGGFALVIKDKYLRLLAGMLFVATVINTSGEYVISEMATQRSKVYASDKLAHQPAVIPQVRPETPVTADAAKQAAIKTAQQKYVPEFFQDYAKRAAIRTAQEEYITKFFSDYYFLVNLVSALLQGVLVAWLLVALGVRRSLFIMPVIVLGGWFALILFVNMAVVRVEKTTENSLDYSLHNTLRQALFLPTSAEAKYKAKAAIDTFFFRMGDVVAGVGIVFLFVRVLDLGVRSFAILNVCLAAMWIVLAYRTGRMHDKLVEEQKGQAPAS